MLKIFLPIIYFAFLTALSLKNETVIDISVSNDTLQYPEEHHFKNMRQLTFGGDNAEAYFSFDGKYIVFQRTDPSKGIMCDQIWMGKIPESDNEEFSPKLVSTGTGRTTCAFFYPDGKHILYASTHLGSADCPPVPDKEKMKRYIWPIYETFDIFKADLNGKIVKRLTSSKG
jgi:TolB protein